MRANIPLLLVEKLRENSSTSERKSRESYMAPCIWLSLGLEGVTVHIYSFKVLTVVIGQGRGSAGEREAEKRRTEIISSMQCFFMKELHMFLWIMFLSLFVWLWKRAKQYIVKGMSCSKLEIAIKEIERNKNYSVEYVLSFAYYLEECDRKKRNGRKES